MPRVDVVVECPIPDSFRVRQVAGLFDVPLQSRAAERFSAEVPSIDEDWQIGVIVGPSGSGKSTLARHAFGEHLYTGHAWPHDKAVIDAFPAHLSIKQISHTLTAVGFSSPPSWLKPYTVLSNGERFRCDLAMALLVGSASRSDAAAEETVRGADPTVVFDEFTSVVDRTVAKIASAAVAKSIRAGRIGRRLVAVTCHYDVIPWLEADWVIDMATGELARGRLCRPKIVLRIRRAPRSLWDRFKRHHYLNASLHASATCFAGYVDEVPATFTAVLYFPHPKRPGYREHRTVCHPDFQGVGLGAAMSEFIASIYRATGKPYYSTTGHPALIHHRCSSPLWRVTRPPATSTNPHQNVNLAAAGSAGRITAGFEYVGPARPDDAAKLGILRR